MHHIQFGGLLTRKIPFVSPNTTFFGTFIFKPLYCPQRLSGQPQSCLVTSE